MPERDDDALAPRHDPRRLRDEDEMDRAAKAAPKSDWVAPSDPGAGDPVTDAERRGLNLLGQNDPRGNGAINGVSEPNQGDVSDSAENLG